MERTYTDLLFPPYVIQSHLRWKKHQVPRLCKSPILLFVVTESCLISQVSPTVTRGYFICFAMAQWGKTLYEVTLAEVFYDAN